ncbi:hypothetical protein AQUCO_00700802v1 [Aquilegia coerulea]|uniref:Uncharacterized protein n=1 Tax=Aquilegia coerulea TaxID=218851 RepID=A0A2G5ELQ1_AQUCA|nr:hypothetical protein AQUCO_00700802v1 [Aquilegia coerulea]
MGHRCPRDIEDKESLFQSLQQQTQVQHSTKDRNTHTHSLSSLCYSFFITFDSSFLSLLHCYTTLVFSIVVQNSIPHSTHYH